MADFKNRLRLAIDASGYSQADIVKSTGINKASLSSYLSGTYQPKQNNIYKLALALNVSEGWLMGLDIPKQRNSLSGPAIYGPEIKQYPFVPDPVAAGIPCPIEGCKQLPTIGLSEKLLGKYASHKNILALKVNGESMNKIIPNGSLVIVDTSVSAHKLHTNDIVVFGREYEYSLKHFIKAGEKVIFRPDSTDPRFTDLIYTKTDDISIVGKVVLYIVGPL